MSGTFLDDVLMQVARDAYRAAGRITTVALNERTAGRARTRVQVPGSREPAVQALVDWKALRPSAIRALAGAPPSGQTADHIISALQDIPAPRGDAPPEPRPEITDLAKSFDLAADMIATARYREDFTTEHASMTVSRLAAAVGAISRISAASVARAEPSVLRTKELACLDTLTRACRARPGAAQGEVPGLVPGPGSLPEAISRWCSTTRAALEPREVDARIMHSVPADLQYLHAASTLVLGAATLSGAELRLDTRRAADHLADAQTAWGEVVQAWPREAGTQPAGRSDYEQLHATQRLHESIRDHLRDGATWAAPARIADAMDATETLRAIADLGPRLTAVAHRYADITQALIDNDQIAFPARRIERPGEQGLNLIEEVTRGAWIPLPQSDPAAQRLSSTTTGAALATGAAESALRHTRTGDFRDLATSAAAPTHTQRTTRRPDDPRADSPRITGPSM